MKTLKMIALAAVASLALCISSCTKTTDTGENFGTYTCMPSVDVSSKEGSGMILSNMRDAVILVCRDKNINYRTSENDKLVIAAADEVYNKEKGNANKTMDVLLVFQPAGETDKPSVTVKTYHLTASN
jgi:hypothetical protein